jgi:hypothetical protein
MFQKTAVFRKSSAGQEALARRDPALTMRHRSILIMVDGKRSVEDLGRLAGGDDFEGLMTAVSDLGMIEPASPATVATAAAAPAAAPLAPAAAPAAAAPAQPSLTLPQAQRVAVRRLTDLLGPTAEDLCMKLESARTPQDFLALVKRAEGMLRAAKGEAAADSLAQALAGYRPA